jgi:hypothetical protein
MNAGLGIGLFTGVFAGDGPGGLASAEPGLQRHVRAIWS